MNGTITQHLHNLIALFYDFVLVFELIKFNIQYNLKTESDYNNYLSNCQYYIMNGKDVTDFIIRNDKLEINNLNFFIIMLSCVILMFLIWSLYKFFHEKKIFLRLF